MKGKLKVAGEFALIFSSYNLRRVMSILAIKGIIQRLERLKNRLFAAWCMVRAVGGCKMTPVREAPRWAIAA